MTTNQNTAMLVERVDDIPLLLTQITEMGIAELLDAYFPTHNNWNGLSLGWTAAIWLSHILSQADHRLNRVQDWVAKHIQTISGVTGLNIRALDFSDDRLAIILRYLNQDESWQQYEQEQGKNLIRAYDLSTDIVRLDATTASSHIEPGGIFQLGHSKDHRPDLAQLKIMLASLDPLGLPLATQIVEGNQADDPLYEPAIKLVRTTLNREGVLYVGDCKMAANSIRASIENANDYYLMPLPATIVSTEVLDNYLTPESRKTIEPIYRYNDHSNSQSEQIAEGFELTEINTGETDNETIYWSERRLVIRSYQHAKAEEKSLYKRLKKAKFAINDLIRPRSGYKCIRTLDSFWPAVNKILRRYNVEGLLEIKAFESNIERHCRSYGNKPARIEIQTVLNVELEDNKVALEITLKRLGWRVYATNAPKDKLSLDDAVIAYREEYIIERNFGRLKGKPLSLTPMYLQRDDHATGLVRLLTIGLRVLTLLEFMVRSKLFETNTDVAGLYAGNPKRRTKRPTTEVLLGVFNYIDLVAINGTDGISYHLTTLSILQQDVLDLLGFSPTIYTQLSNPFS